MRIRSVLLVGLGAGAVALALAGCTGGAPGEGQRLGQNGGQGYRGARGAQALENPELAVRGFARGRQAPAAGEDLVAPGRGAQLGASEPARGGLRGEVDPASERTGRDVADVGTLKTLTGILASEGAEWYLDAAEGRYLLHLGNASYVEQIGLSLVAGEEAVVKGLVDNEEVSVVSLELGGKTFTLRSEDGRPAWAGGGRGAGRGGGQGLGRGAGIGA